MYTTIQLYKSSVEDHAIQNISNHGRQYCSRKVKTVGAMRIHISSCVHVHSYAVTEECFEVENGGEITVSFGHRDNGW